MSSSQSIEVDPRQSHLIYEFDGFQLDAQRRVLSSRADGQPVEVTARIFDTLLHLVERPGEVLDKRALMEALWPNVVVEESNLTQTIHTLRRALGERPGEHRFIVTVPGRGYQFVADVRTQAIAESDADVTATVGKTSRVRSHRRILVAFAALSLAALGASLLLLRGYEGSRGTPTDLPGPSIAVLPFVDMSPDRDQQHFSDGLSEEILNVLAQSPALRVIARTSSFSFRDESVDIATIADKLDVTHVLEGSVRKSGERIRITAQLVDATTSTHVWSDTYDREVTDVFAVQTEIAVSVAAALKITLTGTNGSQRAGTSDARAYERYLQGLYFWNRRGTGDIARARDYFEQALQIDPGFARAWAGLAGVYGILPDIGDMSAEDALAKRRNAVERALTLDPNLTEAHVRAARYYWDTGDARAMNQHFERAMALEPSDPLVLSGLASAAIEEGRLDDGIESQRRALAVDPLSAINRRNLGLYLMAAGQWEDAKVELKMALELSPTSLDLNADIAKILLLQQRFDEALTLTQQLPEDELRDQCLALVHHATGRADEADAALARLIAVSGKSDRYVTTELYIAEVYALRGDSDKAFEWLDLAKRQTRREREVYPDWWWRLETRLSPFLRPLHADPRWQALLASTDTR